MQDYNKNQQHTEEHETITSAFTKHQAFLKRFLGRFLSRTQDIDDVLQETYLKAYSAERGQVINSPKSFLFRVARNTALTELKRKSRQIIECVEDYQDEEILLTDNPVEDQAAATEKLGVFCQSVLEMSPQVRRVFLMRKVYGMSQKEIADELGIAQSTVEKHIARGLLVCSEYMANHAQSPKHTESGLPTNGAALGHRRKTSF